MKNHELQLDKLRRPLTMIAVPGGRFEMGGESWTNSSLPVHPVELDAFYMGQYPVTQELWLAVLPGADPPAYFKGLERPVESVSWEDIDQQFLPALNRMTINERPDGLIYRLPTEAEWEYSARGGPDWMKNPFPFAGGQVLDEVAWYTANSHSETKPVGLKQPNTLELYDMSGNVWEWCWDWYDGGFYQKCLDNGLVINPVCKEKGVDRVLRGGGWNSLAGTCRVAYRFINWPTDRDHHYGFRLVLASPLPV